MPKSKRKSKKGTRHLKWATVRLNRFNTEKMTDISDLGQAVAPRTKNKFNPSLHAPEYNDVSNMVVPHMLTVGATAPLKYTRKIRRQKLPGPIGGAG
jgi:hypothetical protein